MPAKKFDGPRDNQRSKVYRSEQYVRIFADVRLHSGDPEECVKAAQKFVNRVLKRKYVQRHYITGPIKVILSPGAAHSTAHAHSYGAIDLPRNGMSWACSEMVLLHEIAHIFAMRESRNFTHDWRFAQIFLDLVRNVMGAEAADALKKEFKRNRVRTAPKRTRNLSPEQREAARQRAVKARAAKEKRHVLIARFDSKIGMKQLGEYWEVGGADDYKVMIKKSPYKMTLRELEALEQEYRLKQEKRHADRERQAQFDADPFRQYAMRTAMEFSNFKPTSFTTITGVV